MIRAATGTVQERSLHLAPCLPRDMNEGSSHARITSSVAPQPPHKKSLFSSADTVVFTSPNFAGMLWCAAHSRDFSALRLKMSLQGWIAASRIMRMLILDAPAFRSTKMMGTSTIRSPRRCAR